MPKQNIREFLKHFGEDDQCLEHLFQTRFGQGHECSKCKKASRWSRVTNEKSYACQFCGHHMYPMAGTIFENSSTPLGLWFYGIFLFAKSRNGVSAKELQRQLGVTYKTAWRMGHKIREYMAAVDGDATLSGIVEVDETYVGGYERGAQGGKGKAVVFGMLERGGDVVTEVVPDQKTKTLVPHIVEHVEHGSEVHTDEHRGYSILSETEDYKHRTVDHSRKEYVGDYGQTTNSIEGYFSQLKRAINGTHVHLSPQHLEKYAKEIEYRYNRRKDEKSVLNDLLKGFPKG